MEKSELVDFDVEKLEKYGNMNQLEQQLANYTYLFLDRLRHSPVPPSDQKEEEEEKKVEEEKEPVQPAAAEDQNQSSTEPEVKAIACEDDAAVKPKESTGKRSLIKHYFERCKRKTDFDASVNRLLSMTYSWVPNEYHVDKEILYAKTWFALSEPSSGDAQ